VSANQPVGIDGKLWVMPALLEVFGFSSVLKFYDTLDAGKPWHVWLGYAVSGAMMIIGGVVWAVFRKRIAELWPWHQLRVAKLEHARLSQENSDLRENFSVLKEIEALPVPRSLQITLDKPQHNVQYSGFEVSGFDDESISQAYLLFQNLRMSPDQLLGKFEWPRLRFIYYDNSTGQEIADLVPLLWSDSENGPPEITATGSNALIASYYGAKWHACEIIEPTEDYAPRNKYHWIDLPVGEVRIDAHLSGNYGNSPSVTVNGLLTLRQDGTASFQRTSN